MKPRALKVLGADASTPGLAQGLAALLPQLSQSPPPGPQEIAQIVADPDTTLWIAREADAAPILGTLTLVFYRVPTGLKARIDDVVVDRAARGQGVGQALCIAAIAEARRRGARYVELTSRPERSEARRLYEKLGFRRRDTGTYRLSLDAAATGESAPSPSIRTP